MGEAVGGSVARLVYLDESGDPGFDLAGGASAVYVVAAVVMHSAQEAEESAAAIADLRRRLGLRPDFQFHFVHLKHEWRTAFFEAVRDCSFVGHAAVLHKGRLVATGMPLLSPAEVHLLTTGLLAASVAREAGPLKVFLDREVARRSMRDLGALLRGARTQSDSHSPVTLRAVPKARNNALMQLADMVAGAVARSYRVDRLRHGAYRQVIADRMECVVEYPDTEGSSDPAS